MMRVVETGLNNCTVTRIAHMIQRPSKPIWLHVKSNHPFNTFTRISESGIFKTMIRVVGRYEGNDPAVQAA